MSVGSSRRTSQRGAAFCTVQAVQSKISLRAREPSAISILALYPWLHLLSGLKFLLVLGGTSGIDLETTNTKLCTGRVDLS